MDALVHHLDPKIAHFKKRCVGVRQSETDPALYILDFADGTTASANVVLGADGIKSAVRGYVTKDDPKKALSFSNTICYRGLVKTEDLKAIGVKMDFTESPVTFCGPDKVIIIF